jgi:UDP-GlcNAc:undecaprenyl-phosphate GlcNAc-1-phosphate transferase
MDVALVTVALGVAGLAGGIGTWIARLAALRFGIVNAPNPIVPDHVRPVPYLGGLGIAAGVFVAVAAALVFRGGDPTVAIGPLGILLGAALFLVIGLADDLLTFGATAKIVLQFGSAAFALAMGGLVPSMTGLPILDTLIATAWIVTIVNGFNFIDVSDGLAATLAAVTALLFALTVGAEPIVAIAVVGACAGFLVFNRPPARIFMGDAGSLFLGFLLAAFALTARVETTWWPYLPMIALFLAIPLFDLVFQASTRMLEGRPWWIAGPDSYALRLQRAGLSKVQVAAVSALVTVGAWIVALSLPSVPTIGQIGLVVAAALVAYTIRTWLLRFTVQRREPVTTGEDRNDSLVVPRPSVAPIARPSDRH